MIKQIGCFLFLFFTGQATAQSFMDLTDKRPELRTLADTLWLLRTPRRIFTDCPPKAPYPHRETKSEMVARRADMLHPKKEIRDTLLIIWPLEMLSSPRVLQRFVPTNGDYNIAIVNSLYRGEESSTLCQYIITYLKDGTSKYGLEIGSLGGEENRFLATGQWMLNEKMELARYELRFNPPYDDPDSITAERCDFWYQIEPDGKIKSIKNIFYGERRLPKNYFDRLDYNIWEDGDFKVRKLVEHPASLKK